MKTSELMSGIGVVIDDALTEESVVKENSDGHEDLISQIVNWFESEWNVPFVKRRSLPDEVFWSNMLRVASFVLLDWNLWATGGEAAKRKTIDDITRFLKSAKQNLVPVFILTNESPDDVMAELATQSDDEHSLEAEHSNFLFVKPKSSFWNGESVEIEHLEKWVYGNASIYALKTWSRTFDQAKSELFDAMCKRSVNWPRIFWQNYREDSIDPSVSLTTLINDSLMGRMRVDAFQGRYLDGDTEDVASEELRRLIAETSFRSKHVLPDDEVRCGDLFRSGERTFWLNLRPDCDCIPRGSRTLNNIDVHCVEGKLIDRDKLEEQKFEYGQFLSPVGQSVVFGIVEGDSILVRFNKLRVCKYSELKKHRIGRLLHPYVTTLQQRYATYIQRQGLPRIPEQALPWIEANANSVD